MTCTPLRSARIRGNSSDSSVMASVSSGAESYTGGSIYLSRGGVNLSERHSRLARSQTWSQMPVRFLRLKSSRRSYTAVGEELRRHAGSIPRPEFRRHSGRLEDLRREVTKADRKSTRLNSSHR